VVRLTAESGPATHPRGTILGEFGEILVSKRASRNVPAPVLVRCARQLLAERIELPPNESWQEPAVTDIDGQSVIMVLCVVLDPSGRRKIAVEEARYKPKEGRERS
jgi:hypothetical protein